MRRINWRREAAWVVAVGVAAQAILHVFDLDSTSFWAGYMLCGAHAWRYIMGLRP